MNSATHTCMRHPDWEYAVNFSVKDPHDFTIPSGIFCSIEGNRYHPTITCSEQCFYDDKMRLGLAMEAGPISGPMALVIAGTGSSVVTNTGPTPLTVGQTFTVEYPSEAMKRVQAEAVKMSHTRHAHTKIQFGEAMWGNFPATVGHTSMTRGGVLESRLEKEITEGSQLGPLMSLGKLMTLCREAGNTELGPVTYYTNIRDRKPQTKEMTLTTLRQQMNFMKKLLRVATEAVEHYRPRIIGIVQHAVLGNSDTIPVGAQCYAIVTFK